MIPRPKSESAARYNPGRWICTTRPELCDGHFAVYGQLMTCPIRAKCFWGRKNIYEWTAGPKVWGRCLELDVDAERRREHGRTIQMYRRLFGIYTRPEPTEESRERHARRMREKRARERANRQAFANFSGRAILPCGEDCEGGCPYDGPCPYTDAQQDELAAREKKERERELLREKREREKARIKQDPEYAAHMKELNRKRVKRYYEAHKEELRAKARERWRLKHNKK